MENTLIYKLKSISHEYKFQEKILIVPNFDIGYQILESLVCSGLR